MQGLASNAQTVGFRVLGSQRVIDSGSSMHQKLSFRNLMPYIISLPMMISPESD